MDRPLTHHRPLTILTAVVAMLAMLAVAAPASADRAGPTPYFTTSDVACAGNSAFDPRVDEHVIHIYPRYDETDSRRFTVMAKFHIQRWNGNRWVASEEYDGGWASGRSLSPTPWKPLRSTSATTVRGNPGGSQQRVTFEVAPGYYRVRTALAFRQPGGSWRVSAWMSTETYSNVTYKANYGGRPEVKSQHYCDTTTRRRSYTVRPSVD